MPDCVRFDSYHTHFVAPVIEPLKGFRAAGAAIRVLLLEMTGIRAAFHGCRLRLCSTELVRLRQHSLALFVPLV